MHYRLHAFNWPSYVRNGCITPSFKPSPSVDVMYLSTCILNGVLRVIINSVLCISDGSSDMTADWSPSPVIPAAPSRVPQPVNVSMRKSTGVGIGNTRNGFDMHSIEERRKKQATLSKQPHSIAIGQFSSIFPLLANDTKRCDSLWHHAMGMAAMRRH